MSSDDCLYCGLGTDDFVVEHDRIVARNGLKQVDLAFEGIQLVLTKKGRQRDILDGSIRGRARPGRMLAIMGPSGAGKSTVLHAIAGRIKDSSSLNLYGTRYWNGTPLSEDSLIPAAFIEQDVSFFPHMTVRETLAFRVELKLGSLLSKQGRDAMVEDLLDEMGLARSADTIVGDAKVRGVSGGERKRLSIAVEMISKFVCGSFAGSLISTLRGPNGLAHCTIFFRCIVHIRFPVDHLFGRTHFGARFHGGDGLDSNIT
jgi:ABC-type lipoprotein export system ATPase subunit